MRGYLCEATTGGLWGVLACQKLTWPNSKATTLLGANMESPKEKELRRAGKTRCNLTSIAFYISYEPARK